LKPTAKIDFRTITMMQLRNSPGEYLDQVAKHADIFVIERNGQPKACLVPVSFLLPDIPTGRIASEISRLREKGKEHTLTINETNELVMRFHESAAGQNVIVSIVLPHGYPDSAPRILAEPLRKNTPGRWPDGSLAIFGATAKWSARSHDVVHAHNLARVWLRKYAIWRQTGKWQD
jgi:hypothetical protein